MATTYLVLDVSKFNTVTDYKAAATSVKGVIIRCGYRGYGASGTLVTDSSFKTHYDGFFGRTKIGVYWLSQAVNTTEAIEEANYVYSIIRDCKVDFPIYLQSEYGNSSHTGRADELTKEARTEVTVAFCERMKELGYRGGVLATDTWFDLNLDTSVLEEEKYSLWVTKISSEAPTYVEYYDAWRYTDKGEVEGHTGNANLTYFYRDVAGWTTPEEKVDINNINHSIEYTTTVYDGTSKCPTVTFENLQENMDFYVEYVDNINAGEATAVVTGIEPLYGGTVRIPYNIEKQTLIGKTINLSQTEYIFNNLECKPEYSIDGLTNKVDYTGYYRNNTNAGTAEVIIEGKGNYKDEISTTFTINPLSIESMNHSMEKKYVKYTGDPVTPKMRVGVLVEDTDYIVAYENNIDIGTGIAIATGVGNYTGSVSDSFYISYMDIAEREFTLKPDKFIFNGLECEPTVVSADNLTKGLDYTVSFSNNLNAGLAIVNIIGLGDYSGSTKIMTFTIEPMNLYGLPITAEYNSVYYDSEAHKPKVTINNLVEGTDYKLNYSNNINPGKAKIVATGIGNYTGNLTTYFSILEKAIKDCCAKYGTPSIKTIYRIDNNIFKLYANEEKYQIDDPLAEGIYYTINNIVRKQYAEFTLVTFNVKGLIGFTGSADFNFRVIAEEPDIPIDYRDDGVYNFGDIDDMDETAEGDYDYGDLDEGVDPESIAEGDYDFDALSGMYLDKYDDDDGSKVDEKGHDKGGGSSEGDNGVYNFGDIDADDETAEGDYDFGDLDEGVDPESVASGDYDFNKFAEEGAEEEEVIETWSEAGTPFMLSSTAVYPSFSAPASSFNRSGLHYIYNNILVNGRIRIARTEAAVDICGRCMGWVNKDDLINLSKFSIRDYIYVMEDGYATTNGSDYRIETKNEYMYIVYIEKDDTALYKYGLSYQKTGSIICYVSEEMICNIDEVKITETA